MSNRLSMAKMHSIETLHASGHSNREIARLLGIHRETVNKYVRRLVELAAQNRQSAQTLPEEIAGENRPSGLGEPREPGGPADTGRLAACLAEAAPSRSGPQSLCVGYVRLNTSAAQILRSTSG